MATENALMAAALTPGSTVIHNAASEPHVQDLARLLMQMGARIEGIGSNLLIIHGQEELGGADYAIGPDHIEIGSFIALAACTGGELRIRDCVADDLRMTRLAFERLGCRIEFDGDDVVVPAGQHLRVKSDEGEAVSKIEDGPWPAFPADLTSIALAIATQADGLVLIHEKMFENRLFFVDKLVSMGARVIVCDPHRAVVSGPSRLHGERMESPDIRAGMAMLIAALCAEGTSEIGNIRQIDRGYERIDERLRGLGARIERVATRARAGVARRAREPPDPAGHARRAARRDARAARDLRAACGPRSRGPATARCTRPRSSTRTCCAAARSAPPAPATAPSTSQGDVLALRSDMTIPIARVVATRYAEAEPPLRFCYFAHAWRDDRARGRGAARVPAGRDRADRRRTAPEGEAEVMALTIAGLEEAGLRRHRVGVGDGSLYRRLLAALGGARGRAPAAARVPVAARPRRRSRCACPRLGGIGERERELLVRPARSCAAGRRCSSAPTARSRRPRGAARPARAARRARRGRPRDLRPRARARARLLHGRGVRGLRPGRRLRARRRRALRRPARALRPLAAGLRGRARRPAGAHGPGRRGGARDEPHDRGPARRAASTARSTCSTRSGVDTGEVRANDRKLLFEDAGIVTMRPSDVPTYVEHGSADIGITGKDVLLEQSHRNVYELLDLGFGRCRMVVAAPRGRRPDRLGAAAPGPRADRDQVPAHRRAHTSRTPAARRRSSR